MKKKPNISKIIIWNGLPVALTGTVDLAKKFHPIVLMVEELYVQSYHYFGCNT